MNVNCFLNLYIKKTFWVESNTNQHAKYETEIIVYQLIEGAFRKRLNKTINFLFKKGVLPLCFSHANKQLSLSFSLVIYRYITRSYRFSTLQAATDRDFFVTECRDFHLNLLKLSLNCLYVCLYECLLVMSNNRQFE